MLDTADLQKLKKLTFPLLMMAQLEGPVGVSVLAEACQVDRSTAQRWLEGLVRLGYVSRQRCHNGYVLPPQGWAAGRPQVRGPQVRELQTDPGQTAFGVFSNKSAQGRAGYGEISAKIGANDGNWGDSPEGVGLNPDENGLAEDGERQPQDGEFPDENAAEDSSCVPLCPRNGGNLNKRGPTTAESITLNPFDESVAAGSGNGEGLRVVLGRLRSCGIGEPKRSRLVGLEWMTPEYIQAWRDHLHARKRLSTGLLIHCLESGDTPPDSEPDREAGGMLADLLATYENDPDPDRADHAAAWQARIESEYPLWRRETESA